MIKLKKAYDDFMPESDATGLFCADKSLTVQSAVEETDINTIVRRFGLTGQLPSEVAMPRYEDFEAVWDYKSAMDMIAEARNGFMRFPGDVRERFNNDPGELIAFCEKPGNLEEARKLGLAMPPARSDPLLDAVKALKPGEGIPTPGGPAPAGVGSPGKP